MASTRLRHDWITDWIRRPDEWMPGTRMPTNFPKGDDGHRISPLGAAVRRSELRRRTARSYARILGGDEQAKAFLSNPDAVTRALRDYVWSIGVNGGTAPVDPTRPAGERAARFGASPAPRAAAPAPAGAAAGTPGGTR